MSKKTGVSFSDATYSVIENMIKDGSKISFASQVNEVINRYRWICKASLPDLSESEWEAILNCYAGCFMQEQYPPYRIASDLMDDRGAIDLAALADSDPEYAALVRKVHAMSQAEQLAILDLVQRFWAGKWDHMENFGAILEELKK